MASIPDSGWVEQIRRILTDIKNIPSGRRQSQALRDAGGLTFWSDGMLASLNKIASGQASEDDLDALRNGYERSQLVVDQAIERLREARDRFRESAREREMAVLIDRIVWGPFGKRAIRGEIMAVLSCQDEGQRQAQARYICENIERLNANINDLYEAAKG